MKKHLSSLIIATVFAITVCLVSLLTWTPAKAATATLAGAETGSITFGDTNADWADDSENDPYNDYNDEYDSYDQEGSGHGLIWIPISLIIGAVFASAYAGAVKKQLHTVEEQTQANQYIENHKVNLTDNSEMFLYHQVTRTPLGNSDNGMMGGPGPNGSNHGPVNGNTFSKQMGGRPAGGPRPNPPGNRPTRIR